MKLALLGLLALYLVSTVAQPQSFYDFLPGPSSGGVSIGTGSEATYISGATLLLGGSLKPAQGAFPCTSCPTANTWLLGNIDGDCFKMVSVVLTVASGQVNAYVSDARALCYGNTYHGVFNPLPTAVTFNSINSAWEPPYSFDIGVAACSTCGGYGVASVTINTPPSPNSASQPGAPWNAVPRTDYPGGDLGQPILNSDPLSCARACNQNNNCIGFVIGNLQTGKCSGSRACCFLKQSLGTPVGQQTFLTAYVNALALEVLNSVIPAFHVLQGYMDSPGNDLRSTPGSSLLACSQNCATTMGCNGFTYVGSSYPDPNVANTCFMKTSVLPLANLKDLAAEFPDVLSVSNASQRALGVTFLSTVTTGGMDGYNALDPGYQRVTFKTAGFPSEGLGTFNFATGCGSTNQPDLVTQLCFRQTGSGAFMDAFRITFQSGYYLSCVNNQIGRNYLWSDLAGNCVPNSETPSFTDYPGVDYPEWGNCININSFTSERIVSARFGDYSGKGSFSQSRRISPDGTPGPLGHSGDWMGRPGYYPFNTYALATVELKTNAGQDFLSPGPESGNLPGNCACDIRSPTFIINACQINQIGCTEWSDWSGSLAASSIAQLAANLKSFPPNQQEQQYGQFLDGTLSSGFLCGYAGSYGQVPNYANLGQTSAMYTFGLMMMHPIAPGGYAVAPATIPLTTTQPVTNGNGLQVSSTVSNIPCGSAGNGQGSGVPSKQFSITSGTTYQLTSSQQQTYGLTLSTQWDAKGSVQIGNIFAAAVTVNYGRTSTATSTDSTTTASSSLSSNQQTTATTLSLPFTCPLGPNYKQNVQCSYSAGASTAVSFSSVSWTSSAVYTLISGKTFNVPVGGTISGNFITSTIQGYNTECEGVYYTSQACQQPPGTIIKCDDADIYSTKQGFSAAGSPIGVQIFKMSPSDYLAIGSPTPDLIIDTCAEILQACQNFPAPPPALPSLPPPPASTLPPPPPLAPQQITSEIQMQQTALQFPEVHLFLGNGPDAQYANVSAVLASMDPYLQAIQKRIAAAKPGQQQPPWLAIWGGNQPTGGSTGQVGRVPLGAPDLAYLMAQVKAKYNCQLMAVISDGSANNICDYCFTVPASLQQKNANGTFLYSGTVYNSTSGVTTLVGGSSFYLSPFFTGSAGKSGALTSIFVMGGGDNQLAELKFANVAKAQWRFFPSAALNINSYGSIDGPIDSIMPILTSQNVAVRSPDGSYASKNFI